MVAKGYQRHAGLAACINDLCFATAVLDKCRAILAAADDIFESFKQEAAIQMLGMPKKVRQPFGFCGLVFVDILSLWAQCSSPTSYSAPVKPCCAVHQVRDTRYEEYSRSGGEAAGPSAIERVESKIQQAQQQSLQLATAAPTTRSLRSRARSACPPTEVPASTRATRRRPAPPVPKFTEDPPAAQPTTIDATADALGFDVSDVVSTGLNRPPPPAPAAAPAAAPEPCSSMPATASKHTLEELAKAKIDAKLAAVGCSMATVKGTVRRARPGEMLHSSNGEPCVCTAMMLVWIQLLSSTTA